MAKIHKNAEKFPIEWDGTVKGGESQGDNIPSSLDIKWGAGKPVVPYVPCWDDGAGGKDSSQCTGDVDDYFFEDFDLLENGQIAILDAIAGVAQGAPSTFTDRIIQIGLNNIPEPPNGPVTYGEATETEFTWGDVSFIQEIMDGIGTGSRRARQDRLNKLDKDKKKKLIHLICRVKGEKVYDDYTEVGSVEVDVDDVELVVERMMGKKLTMEIKSGI